MDEIDSFIRDAEEEEEEIPDVLELPPDVADTPPTQVDESSWLRPALPSISPEKDTVGTSPTFRVLWSLSAL